MQWLNDLSDLANPLGSKLYKVVLSLDALRPALDRHVVKKSRSLESLEVQSKEGVVEFSGLYLPKKDQTLSNLGYERVNVMAEFRIEDNVRNLVLLRTRKFRLSNPEARSGGLMRFASRFIPRVRRRFINNLVEAAPQVFQIDEKLKGGEVFFNLDYFLAKVPMLVTQLSQIVVLRVRPTAQQNILFYVQTNLLMMRLVDFFGPEYISVEEIVDRDALELLWARD